MVKIQWIIIIGLVVWIALKECSTGKDDARIKKLQAQNDSLQIDNNRLEQQAYQDSLQMSKDSVQHAHAMMDKEKEAREKSIVIRRLKQDLRIVQARAEIPELDTLLDNLESLVAIRTSQVTLQGNYIIGLHSHMGKIRDNFSQRLANTQIQYANQKQITGIVQKQAKKGKGLGWKMLAVFTAGAAAGMALDK